MTAEDKVKEKYPKAFAEKYNTMTKGIGDSYFLIWSSRIRSEQRRLGEGKTKNSAWVDAKNYL